jgi:hypothetical protein
MDEFDLQAFRLNLRVALVEQLALYHAVSEPVLNGHIAIADSQRLLEQWLEDNAAELGKRLGGHFREPAQTALYSEEAAEVVKDMKATVAKIAKAYRPAGS